MTAIIERFFKVFEVYLGWREFLFTSSSFPSATCDAFLNLVSTEARIIIRKLKANFKIVYLNTM